jgi:hypothetical protein
MKFDFLSKNEFKAGILGSEDREKSYYFYQY